LHLKSLLVIVVTKSCITEASNFENKTKEKIDIQQELVHLLTSVIVNQLWLCLFQRSEILFHVSSNILQIKIKGSQYTQINTNSLGISSKQSTLKKDNTIPRQINFLRMSNAKLIKDQQELLGLSLFVYFFLYSYILVVD
jgi:hypothetical protein